MEPVSEENQCQYKNEIQRRAEFAPGYDRLLEDFLYNQVRISCVDIYPDGQAFTKRKLPDGTPLTSPINLSWLVGDPEPSNNLTSCIMVEDLSLEACVMLGAVFAI